jgi:hypothetical protein
MQVNDIPVSQVTLVVRAFAVPGFISVLRGTSVSYPRQNFKASYLRLTFSWLIMECDADDELSFKEFWRQFNIRLAIVMLPVLRVFIIRGDSQERSPVYNEGHL